MRLKDDVDLSESALTRRRQRGTNLRGMVPIVVDHGYAVGAALDLKPPVYAVKFLQSFADLLHRDVESKPDGDGGGGIAHIVLAWNVQMKFAQILAVIVHAKNAGRQPSFGRSPALHIGDQEVGALARAVRHSPAPHVRQEAP